MASQEQPGESVELNEWQKTPLSVSVVSDAIGATRLSRKKFWRQRQSTGWRGGAAAGAACSVAVFLVNLIVFLWAESRNNFAGFKGDGKHDLFMGDCRKTRQLNVGAHFLINVLSTILLSASNYCMQCVSAPTRQEVDRAHSRSKWLDIGIQSIRNLRLIHWKRALLYWLLALSSLPLHLFYNSTVFASIAANGYWGYSVNEAFADPASTNFTAKFLPPGKTGGLLANKLFDDARKGKLEKLDPLTCLNEYAQNFQTTRGNVLFVVPNYANDVGTDEPTLMFEFEESIPNYNPSQCPPFSWICEGQTTQFLNCATPCQFRLDPMRRDIASWKPFDKEILYCLSEAVEQKCRLLYSVHLATIVIILNAVKAILMLYLAFGVKDSLLMTMGDAIASFLQHPDATTEGMCLISKREVGNFGARSWQPTTLSYDAQPKSRFVAASRGRWFVSLALFFVAIITVLALLIFGVHEMSGPKDARTIFSLGLGAWTPSTFIRWNLPSHGAAAVVLNVLVANAPQVILSLIYFTYNGLFTSMSLASEWSQRSLLKKGLRVTNVPYGAQRSTYFLQLPYRYAVPLIFTSGILHWLVSQSIFLGSIEAYQVSGVSGTERVHVGFREAINHGNAGDYMTCGYSPVAILSVIIIGVIMVLAALCFGFRKLKSGMPIVGSCSAAISAACHPHKQGNSDGMAFAELQWGALPNHTGDAGHCAYTDEEVMEPEHGALYAGKAR